jgi:DNA (cytosine-5)-methyltransferase 1
LSQILETGPIPPKYFLSGKACAGILRRAERRGKELPGQLRRALKAVADSERISTATGEPSPCASKGGGRIDAESETFVAIPLDLRNATRDPEKHDEQNRQGCGVGAVGEPAPTLTKEFVPGIAHSLRADGFDASEDGTGRGTPLVPVVAPCLTGNYAKQPDNSDTSAGPMLVPVAWDEQINAHVDITGAVIRGGDGGRHAGVMTLAIRGRGNESSLETRTDGTANALLTPNGGRAGVGVGAVAYAIQAGATRENPASGPDGVGVQADVAYTIEARHEVQAVAHMAVRRLTPEECEALQGFPRGYTNIPGAADGPRYKALGNSFAVPVVAWIGRRIKEAYAND